MTERRDKAPDLQGYNMRIEVIRPKGSGPISKREVIGIAERALSMEGAPEGSSVSIMFVTDSAIKALNKKYLKKNTATDVMAFSMLEGRRIAGQGAHLGDVAISLGAARRQAGIFGTTVKKELRLYIVHGILHLLGYDDIVPANRLRMKKREQEILRRVLPVIKR